MTNKNNKKIHFIIEEFNSSGGLKIVTSIANALSTNGFIVDVIVFNNVNPSFYALDSAITVKNISKSKSKFKITSAINSINEIKNVEGLVVSTNFRLAVLCYLVLWLHNKSKKLTFLIQGLDSISLIDLTQSNRFYKAINKFFYVISKNIKVKRIFVSNYIATKYQKEGVVIPNYVNDIFFKNNKDLLFGKKEITIGVVSTSALNKGFDFFLECNSKIREALFNNEYEVKFICATQDRKLVSSISLEDVEFVFPKNETEMSSFYSRCDVLLSCSISEGFNLPVLEAMASGCIVISTDDGAVNDLITNDINGYVLDKRDAYLFSSKLFELLKDEDKINNVSKEARLRAAKFSKVFFDESYLKYFRDTL
nr:glycosyltransferase family 4 protein [uncultured Flavobacterium sp.]